MRRKNKPFLPSRVEILASELRQLQSLAAFSKRWPNSCCLTFVCAKLLYRKRREGRRVWKHSGSYMQGKTHGSFQPGLCGLVLACIVEMEASHPTLLGKKPLRVKQVVSISAGPCSLVVEEMLQVSQGHRKIRSQSRVPAALKLPGALTDGEDTVRGIQGGTADEVHASVLMEAQPVCREGHTAASAPSSFLLPRNAGPAVPASKKCSGEW